MFLFLFIRLFKNLTNNFTLQQVSRTRNLDSNLLSRQYTLILMADFMRLEHENQKLRQSETSNLLGYFFILYNDTELI